MDKQEYWNKLSAKNPNLKCKNVRITSDKLKAIVFQAWEQGKNYNTKRSSIKTGCKEFDEIFQNP